jgi:hypothetical protein
MTARGIHMVVEAIPQLVVFRAFVVEAIAEREVSNRPAAYDPDDEEGHIGNVIEPRLGMVMVCRARGSLRAAR